MGLATGLVRGIEFVETPNEYGQTEMLEPGWYYDILTDKNVPGHKTIPKSIVHESQLRKLTKKTKLVTVHARRNREKITVICCR